MMTSTSETVHLFNGKDLEGWIARGDARHAWSVVGAVALDPVDATRFLTSAGEGTFYNGPGGNTSDIYTAYQHGDCELHVEFVVPKGSNSGVYFMGRYEIQILDSWGETDLRFGTCGGIYARWIDGQHVDGTPPHVNASKPPGQWQTYDVVFRAPRFDQAGQKVANARFERVVWNGQLAHDNVEVRGTTRAGIEGGEVAEGPLMLQGDHGPVAFRNVVLHPLG
jgi:hypothetical protein